MNRIYTIRRGMKVALVGFGRAGQAVLRYLNRRGAELFVSDRRPYEELGQGEQELLEKCNASYEGGAHSSRFLSAAEMVIVSPGIGFDHPVLEEISAQGIPVLGELALAAGKFESPVIAITGTNGKTTVTELAAALLGAAGRKVFVGGNIGIPLFDYFRHPEAYDIVVLEVSSFQLERCGSFMPDVAVLMNITPDHLDRHKTLERYAAAKMRIFHGDGVSRAVMNGDDRLCRQFKYLSKRDSFLFFGKSSDYAACIKGPGITVLTAKGPRVYDLSQSRMATRSGALNSAAALLAVGSFAVDYSAGLETLRSFEPGAHRLQTVAEIDGVIYIDDSKATNTGAVNIGLEQVGSNIILIAGGKDKGDNYQLLRESVRNCVKHMVLIGETARAMSRDLGDLVPFEFAATMEEAVHTASALASSGDTVLLSPASASFDMFDDYKHRGKVFAGAVQHLLDEALHTGGHNGR
ncbi:MAG: UDP-N-acetylmuramoyl-L-alanine--D-glutamate ligase [Desulfocapsaceae bacterium]|nr:UDP-N-acetylmuramoyl-L-alanine--D-glutamate ligase [Desulfocapsaceae bacterium]